MEVTVVIKGAGLRGEDGSLTGIGIFEKRYSFEDPIEFGKFFGPKIVADKIDTLETDIRIPSEARYTWTVKRIEGSNSEMYKKWAEEFADSDVGSVELSTKDVLRYWLQRTQDTAVLQALEDL